MRNRSITTRIMAWFLSIMMLFTAVPVHAEETVLENSEPYVLDVSSAKKPHKWNYVSTITVKDAIVKEASYTTGDTMDINIVLDSSTALDASFTIDYSSDGNKAETYPMEYNGDGFDIDGVKNVNLVNGGAFFSVETKGWYSSKKSETIVWNYTVSIDGVQPGLSLSSDQVEIKGVGTTTTIMALNANGDIQWSSSDEKVVTVENGVLTSVGLGSAIVTATSGEQTAECRVSVVEETVLNVSEAVKKPHSTWGYLETIIVRGNILVKEWTQEDTTVNIILPKDTKKDAVFDLLFTGVAQNIANFNVKYNDVGYKNAPLPVQLNDGEANLTLEVIAGNQSCEWYVNIKTAEDDAVTVHRTTIETGAQYIEYTTDVWCSKITVVGPEVIKSKVTEYAPEDRKIIFLLSQDTAADAEGKLEFTTEGQYPNNMKYNVENPYSYKLEDGKISLNLITKGNFNPAKERNYNIVLKNSNTVPAIREGVQDVTADWATQAVYSVNLDEVFEDADGDELDYTVSIDGKETPFIDTKWSYPADTTGEHVLIFTASDGLTVSEQYKVTLNVKNNDNTFDVTFKVPDQIIPEFYVNYGYDDVNGDVLGDRLKTEKKTALMD